MTEQMSICSIFIALSNKAALEGNRCPHQKLYLEIYVVNNLPDSKLKKICYTLTEEQHLVQGSTASYLGGDGWIRA